MTANIAKTTLVIALVATLAALQFATALQAQQTNYPPSQSFRRGTLPPVGVRPQQNNTPLPAAMPGRISTQQVQQFSGGSIRSTVQPQSTNPPATNRPGRVHRLSDVNLQQTDVRPEYQSPSQYMSDNSRPENIRRMPAQLGVSPQQSNIQRTSFTGVTQDDDSEPFVPEILRKPEQSTAKDQKTQTAPQQQTPKPVQQSPADTITNPTAPVRTVQNTLPPVLQNTQSQSGVALPRAQQTPLQQFGGISQQPQIKNPLVPAANTQPKPLRVQQSQIQPTRTITQVPANQSLRPTQSMNQTAQPMIRSFRQNQVSLASTSPAVQVQTTGPKSISIGKTATYQIKIRNLSGIDANRISVAVKMPSWIDVSNVLTTSGQRDLIKDQTNVGLTWNVSSISAGQSQTMTMDVVARKAEVFNVDVAWKMEAIDGSTKIEVTEPKLAMHIVGPDEVLFGQKAMYTVTVENTGTGLAEDIKVMLSEALGGARAPLGSIEPGSNKKFQVELTARSPGQLELVALAVGDSNLRTSSTRKVMVRRAQLKVDVAGPPIKYSGSVATYEIRISNTGDAMAKEVQASAVLPVGVKYLSGVAGATANKDTLNWKVGNLSPGDERRFKIACQMNGSGKVKIDIGARGLNNLVAANTAQTQVETIADLVLSVEDPKGPLPTGEKITYTIRIKNRGSRTANKVDLVMHFSKGIEPTAADGLQYQVIPGEVSFGTIQSIEPGAEVAVKVHAKALESGRHTYRAQLNCVDAESKEVAQGTTKFYGDSIAPSLNGVPAIPASSSKFDSGNINGGTIQPPATDQLPANQFSNDQFNK